MWIQTNQTRKKTEMSHFQPSDKTPNYVRFFIIWLMPARSKKEDDIFNDFLLQVRTPESPKKKSSVKKTIRKSPKPPPKRINVNVDKQTLAQVKKLQTEYNQVPMSVKLMFGYSEHTPAELNEKKRIDSMLHTIMSDRQPQPKEQHLQQLLSTMRHSSFDVEQYQKVVRAMNNDGKRYLRNWKILRNKKSKTKSLTSVDEQKLLRQVILDDLKTKT